MASAAVKPTRWAWTMCVAFVLAFATAAAPAQAWQPEGAAFGVGELANQSITMSDGTVLSANVYYPTDPKTGQEAAGPFPVILTQTPYGKDDAKYAGGGALSELAGQSDYLIQRGYIQVVADVRGTGGSEGEWGLFDPIQGTDGATLVNWSAALPHSDGKVGLLGASYLGIDQFATAVDAGPTHVKAMFPIISGNDIYKDTAFAGGFPDIEFSSFYLGLTGSLNLILPAAEGNSDLATALTQHVRDLADFDASLVANIEAGGDQAYDSSYWQDRSPVNEIAQIVKDGIPAFLVGGWYDLFQRGEPLNYSGFQNAWDHRPVLAPMAPDQPVTPRYQLIQGPWYHVTAGTGLDYHGLDMDGVELAWFDHWLKGIDTGITDTTTPLHLEDLATGNYVDASRYPLNQATPTTYYLQPSGSLSTAKPAGSTAPDPLLFTGTEIPCTNSTEQWAAGLGALALSFLGLKDPCSQNDVLSQVGPGTQTYTTAPFKTATTLAGPIGATLYATSTTTDTEWVLQLSDVAPNGTSAPLTSGLLEGDQRSIDPSLTWYGANGDPILPFHPYTAASASPVVPGQVTRYDVEVFPTFDTLEPGHRLRVTVATSDFPHALPTVIQIPHLLGGVYELEHSSAYPSSIEVPLARPASFTATTRTALGCPAPSGRLAGAQLGPVRLGDTRAQARKALRFSSNRGRRYMDFFCLSSSGIRIGYASPKLLRTVPRRQRARYGGRAVLILTANRHFTLRGIRLGSRVTKQLGKPFKVGLNTWYLIANGASRGIVKTRNGRIEELGIANKALTAGRARAWRFLESFS
jgi:putative CocE/NonD family hydrolase